MDWNKLTLKEFLKRSLDLLETIKIEAETIENKNIIKDILKLGAKIEYKLNNI